jgi:hypothetical protein
MSDVKPRSKFLSACLIAGIVYFGVLLMQLRQPSLAYHALFKAHIYLVFIAIMLLAGITVWRSIPRRQLTIANMISITGIIGFAIGSIICVELQQPLRFCFGQSLGSFDAFVANHTDFQSADKFEPGSSVGYYRVYSINQNQGATLFRTDNSESPRAAAGFAFMPNGVSDTIDGRSIGLEHAKLTKIRNNWYVFYSWYDSMKLGPS